MRCHAGLDVSLETTSICVIDANGAIVLEGSVETHPLKIAKFLKAKNRRYQRVAIEASATGVWLSRQLTKIGLPVVCVEALHAHRILSGSRRNKTDRNDARGLAEMMLAGVFRSVHLKSEETMALRAMLTARRLLMSKLIDLENGIGGILRAFGVKIGRPSRQHFEILVRAHMGGRRELLAAIEPLLSTRLAVMDQFQDLDQATVALARADPVCQRLTSAPGIGPLIATTFRTTIDVPERFRVSRTVGAYLGLTPRTRQSGAVDSRGRSVRQGDVACRSALVQAARVILNPRTGQSPLKRWATAVQERRGYGNALVALARRLSVLLHRIWIDGTTYDPERAAIA